MYWIETQQTERHMLSRGHVETQSDLRPIPELGEASKKI